ncbi:MAG: MAPEG family protein [Lysobacteraceae bacterium]
MSIAYWCILVAAALPYLWVAIGRFGVRGYDNHDPRGWNAAQTFPRTRRGYAAHLNAFEAFAPFAAGVLAAQAAGVDPGRIATLAIAFIVCRILHGTFYLADLAALRSLSWMGGLGCVLALLAQAALKAA